MIDISKTHTETNTEKIFNTDTIYILEWLRKKLTETVIEMTLITDTEIICLPLPEILCNWNDVNTETELKLFLKKNFIETRTENNSDTV